MKIDSILVVWVEYCICEASMDIYPKIKTNSTTFRSFCGRLKDSIERGSLGERDERVLKYITFRVKREYRIPNEELASICANFFIDEKWDKYIKVIKLMENIRYQL